MKKMGLSFVSIVVTLFVLVLLTIPAMAAENAGPEIASQPKKVSVGEGQKAAFSVAAVGEGDLTYQWQVKKTPTGSWKNCTAAGYDQPTYSFKTYMDYSGRQYRCKVTDENGTTTSAAALLTVLPKPVITQNPQSQTVFTGQKAVFSAAAVGEGDLIYQWQVKKNPTGSWKNCTAAGFDQPTYSFKMYADYSGRQYRCKVTDANGTVYSASALLTADLRPQITKQPAAQNIQEGETVRFSVTAKGNGLSYQWQVKKTPTGSWKNCTAAGYDQPTYSFKALADYSGRQYRCKVTNESGTTVSEIVSLRIFPAPEILRQPESADLLAGEMAVFTVEAAGNGTLTYQWQVRKNDEADWTNCTVEGAATPTYSFKAQVAYTGRRYRCRITDEEGIVYSQEVMLAVSALPKITKQPVTALTVEERKVAVLSVSATGTSKLQYQWQERKSSTASWKDSTLPGAKFAEFQFTARAGDNGHQYRCRITDANGTVYSKAATLTVTEGPALSGTVHAVDGRTAVLSVVAPGTGSYTYQWQVKKSASWSDCTLDSSHSANFSFTAYTAYSGNQYRCRMTKSGTTTYSQPVTLLVTTTSYRPTVKKGSSGTAVKELQQMLNALGYDCGQAGGVFNDDTESAVRIFQSSRKLTVDGEVGPETWTSLESALYSSETEEKPVLPDPEKVIVSRVKFPDPDGSGHGVEVITYEDGEQEEIAY